ncbi:phospholipase D-like domain-containing protein [Solwaraspora sp. WMMD792]|uniref:phospholipase D family protein n=1 Tax=Solwaraspora sp. WMMD792 TaxID=3016099 RepID=UPI002415F663|nr:phospholipase D-like domain-containing protein [Solwaraspora sp. WMMD792]MDG4772959.1 phospholipase D-like domain-containing protein [Solwaraspora sp. WMMD792]
MPIDDWFLTGEQRGNPASGLPAWSEGNQVRVHVHGAAYFDRLVEVVAAMGDGDQLFFTDWRGDPDQRLRPDGPTVADLLSAAAGRGVAVRGLVWRSHLDVLIYSAEQNRNLAEEINDDGGQVLLDQRVRRFGSHHQKLVVARHPGRPERDVAFAGGIDLCHSRRDDAAHLGDPQPVSMSPRYGDRPPWHDVQLELRGPVVAALDLTFRERWTDPAALRRGNPVAMLRDRLAGRPARGGPLPAPADPPAACGPHAVQVLRTYPAKSRPYPYAPHGERTVALGYAKAIRRARRLIYLEDQYMWSSQVAQLFADALRANPDLHLIVVVPRHPDVDGRLALPPNVVGREHAIDVCRRADPDRVHVFDVENHAGTPVYVHAKVCVVDDVWASVGSDNFNRRSWTHDSELSCAVLDDTRDPRAPYDPAGLGDHARTFARDLRLTLLREHLDRAPDGSWDHDLLDPADTVRAVGAAADTLDAWYRDGRRGPRPAGRLRRHDPAKLSTFTRAWATPPYRLFYDPDGRPRRLRRTATW